MKVAIENLNHLVNTKEHEDLEYLQGILPIYARRLNRSDIDEEKMEKNIKLSRLLLEELGLRSMPAEQTPRKRIPNQVETRGCPKNPCVGKQHCDIRAGGCGLHGHRFGDEKHDCEPKFGL